MNADEFEDLFAESHVLANLPQNAPTPRTTPEAQALGQEREGVMVDDTSVPYDLDSVGKENEYTFQSGSLQRFPASARLANARVISKIEAIFESLADGILEDRGSLAVPLRTRASKTRPSTTSHPGAGVADDLHQPRDVCFPGSTPQEAWRFSTAPRL